MAELDSGRERLSFGPDKAELDRRIVTWSTDELIDAVTFLLEKLKLTGSYEEFMSGTIGSLHPNNDVFKDALRKVWRAGDLITTTNYDLTIEKSIDAETSFIFIPCRNPFYNPWKQE